MPRRNDIAKVLIIGSGPIVIGQSAEFDYSGAQACKALKSEGYEVVLANSNPATIMTDPEMADRTYIEPLTRTYLEEIIRIEAEMLKESGQLGVFALLPTVGGQTALNLAVELADGGVLEKYGVQLIGAQLGAIKKAEDRLLFKDAMTAIGLDVPKSSLVNNLKDGIDFSSKIGFPVILRPSFTLGGTGGGIAYNREELLELLARGLDLSPVHEVLHRRVSTRLEGVRAGADARPGGQRHRHLLDRELRSDGSAHRRFDHRGARADADRSRIPDDARRGNRRNSRNWRRDWRIEHSVRRRSAQRAHGRHRDESARVALVGAGLEGDGIPDREDCSQAGGRLHARRDHQRHHPQDAGVLRADAGLRRRKDSEVAVREVSRRR